MVEILKPGERVRVAPFDQLDREEADQVGYGVRAPSLYDKARLDRAVMAQGARAVGPLEVLDALVDGVAAILPDPADAAKRDEILASLADFRTRAEEDRSLWFVPDPDVVWIQTQVRAHVPRFAELEAARDWYWAVRGIEATRLFLLDAEDPAIAVAFGANGVEEATIMAIPEADRTAIALKVSALLAPSEGQVKNSGSPSSGSTTPANSTTTPNGGNGPKKTPPRPARAGTSKPSGSEC